MVLELDSLWVMINLYCVVKFGDDGIFQKYAFVELGFYGREMELWW